MVLYQVAPGKMYFQIRFEDVPEDYILGGCCLVCAHRGPVNRYAIEKRFRRDARLCMVDDKLKCLACGNKVSNSFTVFGKCLRKGSVGQLPDKVTVGVQTGR